MTLKEIMEKSKQDNRGYIKRKSSLEKNDYFSCISAVFSDDYNWWRPRGRFDYGIGW